MTYDVHLAEVPARSSAVPSEVSVTCRPDDASSVT
jgi:hypothetical protein